MNDVATEVRDILVFHLGADERRLTDDARLTEDLGADSLDVVEIVMSCEERFAIAIPQPRRHAAGHGGRRGPLHQIGDDRPLTR